MFCFPEEWNQQSILNWFINLLISLKLCKSKVDFNANLNCFFFLAASTVQAILINVLVSKRREEIHMEKRADVVSNPSHNKKEMSGARAPP